MKFRLWFMKRSWLVLLFFTLSISGCDQASEKNSSPSDTQLSEDYGVMESEEVTQAPARDRAQGNESPGAEQKKLEERPDDATLSILPMEVAEAASDRMLEYSIQLNFRSDSILKSREVAFEVARKYGFLSSSRTYAYGTQHFRATLRVSSDRLYEALKELEAAGTLNESTVDVTDHTADLVWQSIKLDREQLRTLRRQNLQNRTNAQNQIQAENLISSSEDQQDQAKFEKWKIRDRVKWATVNISVQGPEATNVIEVPEYKNAFINITNSLLALTYWLLENILWLLILGVLIWKWRTIWNAMKSLVGKDE